MSKKKEGRKADSSEEKAQQFIEHLRQYEDFAKFSLDQFPQNLPRRFKLKLGPAVIGIALIDWRAVVSKVFDTAAAMGKPKELSEEEYTEQLKISFASYSPTERIELMLPLFDTAFHMMEFMPQKLNDAVLHLCVEARQKIIIESRKELGSKNVPSAAKFAALLAKVEEEATKKRLPETRGGSDPKIEVNDEQCATLSATYPGLLRHWRNVKRWHKKGANWRDHAKVDEPDTPDDLLDKISSLDPYERQPSVLAHEHAARKCGLPANNYSLSTLSRLRRRGEKFRGQSKGRG